MATRTKKTVETELISEALEDKDSTKAEELKNENEQLKNEMQELKEMMAKLMANQNKKESKEVKIDEIIEIKDIPLNKTIVVTNLFDGELNLKGKDGNIKFNAFGVSRPITYENLIAVLNNHSESATEGIFYIHDKDVRDAQLLSEDYTRLLTKETILNITELSKSQLEEILEYIPEHQKETIAYSVSKGINSYSPKYQDRNKIATISKLIGKDIYKFARALEEA